MILGVKQANFNFTHGSSANTATNPLVLQWRVPAAEFIPTLSSTNDALRDAVCAAGLNAFTREGGREGSDVGDWT